MQQVEGSNDMMMTWDPPSNNGMNETTFYDIECTICVELVCTQNSCTARCACPFRQYNLTKTSVRVTGLPGGKTFGCGFFSKNSLNSVIPRSDWECISREITTRGSTSSLLFYTDKRDLHKIILIFHNYTQGRR